LYQDLRTGGFWSSKAWLTSAELPPSFWFYAVRHAAEVCNYFSFHLNEGTITTLFELVHKKMDHRVLFKIFGYAAVHRKCIGDSTLNKFDSDSIPIIAIG
jgi:hypothetical protein